MSEDKNTYKDGNLYIGTLDDYKLQYTKAEQSMFPERDLEKYKKYLLPYIEPREGTVTLTMEHCKLLERTGLSFNVGTTCGPRALHFIMFMSQGLIDDAKLNKKMISMSFVNDVSYVMEYVA